MVVPEPLNISKKNEGISKKKPGPKVGSKRNRHANRPDSKRLMDQPSLQQQRLDKMTIIFLYQAIIENEDAKEGTENYDEYIQNFSNVSDVTALNSKYLMKRLAKSLLEIVSLYSGSTSCCGRVDAVVLIILSSPKTYSNFLAIEKKGESVIITSYRERLVKGIMKGQGKYTLFVKTRRRRKK
ncbi:hypothetical protein BDF21DRAFT_449752 [Thamnidium elegans]|nr:hypothetical protein BDF21DRAFT_449752 [Thamnidium elegans]